MRRPIVFLFLAAVAAMLASLVVYSSLKKKDEEVARAMAGTVPIVVAAHDIAVGAKIGPDAIKMARWPRDSLPPAAITDASSIIGNVARSEFVQNEPIVASRLVAGDKTSGVLPLMIPNDMRAMSVAVDQVSDMSGFVLPYTRVDVLLSLTGNDKEAGRSKIILEDIPVLAVAQTVQHKDTPQPERVVTLEVTPEQAEALAVATTEGKLHLALRSYGDNTIIPTSGSNVHKVMTAYSTEVPQPVPQRTEAVKVREHRRRVFHRPRPLPHVEVIRNGTSVQTVAIGPDGRAYGGSASSAPPSGGVAPSAYARSLGREDGSEGYGMSAGTGVSLSAGGY